MLKTCAAISTSLTTFTTALDLFLGGASAIAVHTALSRYQKFKAALPSAPRPEFVVPAPLPKKLVATEQLDKILGKRGEPEKVVIGGFTKKVGPMDKFLQSKKQKIVSEEEKLKL
jgi:hypothetical protein